MSAVCGLVVAGAGRVGAITSSACIGDRGFEEPALAPGFRAYDYNPSGTAWTFVGGAGVSRPPNSFSPTRPPEGNQSAFLQNDATPSSICRDLAGLAAGTVYHLRFLYGGRAGQPSPVGCVFCTGANPFAVRVDGATIATFTAPPLETYISGEVELTASSGSARLCFESLDTGVRDRTTFFDEVTIDPCSSTKLFVVSSQGEQSTSEVIRYALGGPTDDPVLETSIRHSSFDHPCGVAIGLHDELFVMNRGMGQAGQGSISRFQDSASLHTFNGLIQSPFFSSPYFGVFRDGELFVGQTLADNAVRFLLAANGTASFNGFITEGLGNNAVRGVALSPNGNELFVGQCCGVGSINRYLIDAGGTVTPNGTITGGGLSSPHDLVFSNWGELFVGNDADDTISRFLFDQSGNVFGNGVISGNGANRPANLAFSPWGELFAANVGAASVSRWRFDASFNAIANGSFATRGINCDITFVAGEQEPDRTPTPTAAHAPVATATATATSQFTVATLTPTPTENDTPHATATPTPSVRTPANTATPTTTRVPSTATASATLTATAAGTRPTATATVTGSITPPSPTPTGPSLCVGDCDGSGIVAVNELVLGVNIALDRAPLSTCPASACDGFVNVACLVRAVNNALRGCS